MAHHDLARMTTATTGTGTITLGSAVSPYMSFATAGVADGEIVPYSIIDTSNTEVGFGTYTASGTTLARTKILASTNSGNAINLSGSAVVIIPVLAENLSRWYAYHQPVRVATAAALPAGTYANGSSGVGATFTVTATGTLTVDGVVTALNDRILVNNQASGLQNGVYVVTTAGAVGVAAVLTRDTDADQASTDKLALNMIVPAGSEGTANANKEYRLTTTGAIVVGTTALTFTSAALVPANNLSDVASASSARTNLGLAIGVNVEAFDAQLTSNIVQNAQGVNYTLVLTDGEKHIYHNSATAHTFTIPANSSVAFPIGTVVHFVNEAAGGVLSIAITTDTMYLAGNGATGTRSLAATGWATAIKVLSTVWHISGAGLS